MSGGTVSSNQIFAESVPTSHPTKDDDYQPIPTKQSIVFIEKDNQQYIRFICDDLRSFIWSEIEQELIHRFHLIGEDDNEKVIKDKNRGCQFPIEQVVMEYESVCRNILLGLTDPNNTNRFQISDEYEYLEETIFHFAKIVVDEYEKFKVKILNDFNNQYITFNYLFYALKDYSTQIAVRSSDDLVIAGLIKRAKIEHTWTGTRYIDIQLEVYSHNGKEVIPSSTRIKVFDYEGYEKLNSVGIILLNDTLKQELIERGKKYIDITKNPSYMWYTGAIVRRGYWNDRSFRSDGRVMIDIKAMKSIDPDYNQYFASGDNRCRDDNSHKIKDAIDVTDEMLMCMSPYVYGFSFTAKQWGEFNIDNISPIQFREDAYNMLVMDPDIKDMLFSLVEENNITGKDFIDNKGGGTIFLLAGTPGVGKTLTAETIAEKLRKPLYMVGVGELGVTTEELEVNLRNILDVATSWNAVLLLDEADIFMEERSDIHIERNAMVGIFLRMLEYYQGTLFLTTNRAKSIDPAFFSRISLAIKYDDLDNRSRLSIWNNILNIYGISDMSDEDIEHLSTYPLNGRQIKNCSRIAYSLAGRCNRIPSINDFIKVINHAINFKV